MQKQLAVLATLAILAVGLDARVALAYEPSADPNLIAWWAFDETSGTTIRDSSANGRDGQLLGIPIRIQGVYDSALQLIDSAYIEVPSIDRRLSEATIAAWVKPSGAQGDYATILAEGSASLNLMSDSQVVYTWSSVLDSYSFRDGPYLLSNQWNFIALTIKPDGASFYLNGQPVSVNAVAHSPVDWDGTIRLAGEGVAPDASPLTDAVLDDVSLFDRALTPREIVRVMQGLERPELAHAPVPADGATDVRRDVVLAWQAGESAVTHNVYFGTVLDDVEHAGPDDPRDVLVAHNREAATYAPPTRLEFGQTYYWRVDEIASTPEDDVLGEIWTFTVEPELSSIESTGVTASFPYDPNRGPEKTVDGSGLSPAGQHGTSLDTMWIGDPIAGEPLVLQYNFDGVYKIEQIRVWNFNHSSEADLGFGLKDVTIEYETEADQWEALGAFQLNQAPGNPTYAGEALDPSPAAAKAIRLIATSNYGGVEYGLSEIRFYTIPVRSREPIPVSGAQDVPLDPIVSWRPGREAASHKIHLSDDANAIAAGAALIDTIDAPTYAFDSLDLGTTYFWRVDEVNSAEPIPVWPGELWTFTTEQHAVLEDFEDYTDELGQRIYETWHDGYDIPENGSQVGNNQAPYSESEIVAGGAWSMPFDYKNIEGATFAEAERTFTPSQDWTQGGIKAIALHFFGKPGNTGSLYLKINGEKVPYIGAQADLTRTQWQTWVVDLSTIQTDITAVTTLSIGIGGAGAIGTLYFDDIWLCGGNIDPIVPTPPDPNGLILRYALDEGVGPDVRDTSGGGHNGTIYGAPVWTTGVNGRALSFRGIYDLIDTEASLLSEVGEFSLSCWVKANFASQSPRAFVGQYGCIELGIIGSYTVQLWTANGGVLEFDWPYRETTANWHHLVAVGDGASLRLYVDGMEAATGGQPLGLNDTGYGASEFTTKVAGEIFAPTGDWFMGQIDEVYIYQRALSDAEAAALAGRDAPFYEPLDTSH